METPARPPRTPGAPSLEDYRRRGFPMGGEPLAVDLANTLITVTDPATDLLSDQAQVDAFWQLQAPRLPAGWSAPTAAQTRALRDHVRHILVAAHQGTTPAAQSLAALTRACAAAPTSIDFTVESGADESGLTWHGTGAALGLAATARSLHEVLSGPGTDRLRECDNPSCSMLFVATDARRKWCSSITCGNRARVARHYQRTKTHVHGTGSQRAGPDEPTA